MTKPPGAFKEEINCSDLSFSETTSNGKTKVGGSYYSIVKDPHYTYFDGVLFCHAINNDQANESGCSFDLTDTPFEIHQEKQKFKSFGNCSQETIDEEEITNQFLEM